MPITEPYPPITSLRWTPGSRRPRTRPSGARGGAGRRLTGLRRVDGEVDMLLAAEQLDQPDVSGQPGPGQPSGRQSSPGRASPGTSPAGQN